MAKKSKPIEVYRNNRVNPDDVDLFEYLIYNNLDEMLSEVLSVDADNRKLDKAFVEKLYPGQRYVPIMVERPWIVLTDRGYLVNTVTKRELKLAIMTSGIYFYYKRASHNIHKEMIKAGFDMSKEELIELTSKRQAPRKKHKFSKVTIPRK